MHKQVFKLALSFIIWSFLSTSAQSTLSLKASEEFLEDPFVSLVYEMEIAIICGLATYPVSKGYEFEKKRMIDKFGLANDLVIEKSALARKLADLEWQNRGLGGFKGWCANDGKNITKYFISVFDQQNQ